MFYNRLKSIQDKYLSKYVIFVADLFLSVTSSALLLLFLNLIINSRAFAGKFFFTYVGLSLVISAVLIYLAKSYKIIIRHLGVKDLVPFAVVAFFKALLLVVFMYVCGLFTRGVWIIVGMDFLLTFFLFIVVRVIMILAYDYLNSRNNGGSRRRVLVYGISEKSVATITRLQHSQHFKIVGFLAKGYETKGTIIDQLPVYCFNKEKDLDEIFETSHANAVLFAKTIEAQNEADGLVSYCNQNKFKTLIIPSVDEMQAGENVIRPREINVEDLLGREEIKLNMDAIKKNFEGKVVLVTGAAGSIGSELVRQLSSYGVRQIILYDNAETPMHELRLELEDKHPGLSFVPLIGDVRQDRRLDYAFRKFRPQVVFHAAAYKHVPLMEENPCEAVLVNVLGSRQVADKCIQYDVEKMVMISTDKAVNPTNIMGCTKRLAEIYVQSLGLALEKGVKQGKTVFVTTRFGNVLGSNGSVIPRFREQIAAGGPVTVTHPEINRFFMTIPEACRLVMEAATMANTTEIFAFDMGNAVKIDTLARRMISLAGFIPDKDIKIEYTGLRPGEKLYEEVLATNENTLPTNHQRIRIAKVRDYDFTEACKAVEHLVELSRQVEIHDLVLLMKQVVPEFKSSKNSDFAAIDVELAGK